MRVSTIVALLFAVIMVRPAWAAEPTGKWEPFETIEYPSEPNANGECGGIEGIEKQGLGNIYTMTWQATSKTIHMAAYTENGWDTNLLNEEASVLVRFTRGFEWKNDDPNRPADPTGVTFTASFGGQKDGVCSAEAFAETLPDTAYADVWGTAKLAVDGSGWVAGAGGQAGKKGRLLIGSSERGENRSSSL